MHLFQRAGTHHPDEGTEMGRKSLVLIVLLVGLGACMACKRQKVVSPVVVHVLRDPSAEFAPNLRRATAQFDLTKPRLADGRQVMIATNEGESFTVLMQRLKDMPPEVLILDSPSDLPNEPTIQRSFRDVEPVCGGRPAYIPTSLTGEELEAAKMYLRYMRLFCSGKQKH
jgi:hypothetical protein